MNATEVRQLKRQGIRSYRQNGGVSFLQAFLKHSLIPGLELSGAFANATSILDLGCGEGILSNLLARMLPQARVLGIDRDAPRLQIAQKNAEPNAAFREGDIFCLPDDALADGIIFNDVLHHLPYAKHIEMLDLVLGRMPSDGTLVLKEVDQNDWVDRRWTTLFDSRLYPNDPLCFRTTAEWLALLKRLGVKEVRVAHVRHPWPSSRTLFIARCPKSTERVAPWTPAAAAAPADQASVDVFITGATGFIAAHLARRLLAHGLCGRRVRLLLLARDPDRIPDDLRNDRVVPILAELDELPRHKSMLANVEYVFHLAAEVKFAGGSDVVRHNQDGTASLLEAFRGIPLRRFVHASTIGAVDRQPGDPCTRPLVESDPPHPLSLYGEAKLNAERAVQAAGFPFTIVRVPWCYGQGMRPDMHVRFLLGGVAKGKMFSIFNFPGRVSIIYVDDLVRGFQLAAESEKTLNETYFVNDGRPIPLGTFFRQMGEVTGTRAAFVPIPWPLPAMARAMRRFLPLTVQNLFSDVLCASADKFQAIGFSAECEVRDGLRETAHWHFQSLRNAGTRDLAVVTGGGGGIGAALCRQLYARGFRVAVIDRNEEAARQVAAPIHGEVLAADLSTDGGLEAAAGFLSDRAAQIAVLVNNAGIGRRGEVAGMSAGDLTKIVRVNCDAPLLLSRAVLPEFLASGRGTIVNIGSSAALQPLPYMAAYSASKAFLVNFSEALSGELGQTKDKNLEIITVLPSGTNTGFQAAAGVNDDDRSKLLTPDHVAAQIVRRIGRGSRTITIGRVGKIMGVLGRALPRRVQVRLWAHLMQKMR